MGSATPRDSVVTYDNSRDCGNVIDSHNTQLNNCNISLADERLAILEWLSPLKPRERHEAIRDSRTAGVGDWLLDTREFIQWHESDDETVSPVLFCYGSPGAGKTYLSSLVIDKLCGQASVNDIAVACMYCDFHAQNEQSAVGLLRALLVQVVSALEPIPDGVRKEYESSKGRVGGCRLLLPEILGMLVKCLSFLRRAFICIDALDEFHVNGRRDLWQSLQWIVKHCPNIRLFMTGRSHIRDQMPTYFPSTAEVLISPSHNDIELHLRMKLDGDPETDAMNKELKADILRIIPRAASGIFLLASLGIDEILARATVHQRKQALDEMTKGLVLEGVYRMTLDRINQQGESKSKIGMEALMWIAHCERPLGPEELRHALGVELGSEDFSHHNVPTTRTVRGCTLGLVAIDERSSTVRLLHLTLQEYLRNHYPPLQTAHSMMAEICLTYLNCRLVRGLQNTATDLGKAPFLKYATCFWGTHATVGVTTRMKSLASRLLDGYENQVSATILWRNKICGGRYWEEDVREITGFHCIAFWGIEEIAVAMLEMKKWDLNGRDSQNYTPLMWAVEYRNDRIVKMLLEQKDVELDAVTQEERTVLSFAAQWGNKGAVELLLGHEDVDPNWQDSTGRTPLSLAAINNRGGVVKLLLGHREVKPDLPDNGGRAPLSLAASEGHEGIVELLLGHGEVKPDLSDNDGRTPLSLASSRGYDGIVRLLLKREEVKADSSDNDGRTPLSLAAAGGHEGIVELLVEREEVNPGSSDTACQTPLSLAASGGYEGIVKLLMKREEVKPDLADKNGRTPLSLAASVGHEGVVKLLLQRREVKPDSSDKGGRTPLSLAASGGHEGVVKLLLQRRDVKPDSSDKDGRTPLSLAASGGHESAVRLLLQCREVNPNSPDIEGRTPLSHAAGRGADQLMEQILEHAAVNPYSPDSNHQANLPLAPIREGEVVVNLLLERGDVNPDLPDSNGRTPLSFAAAGGNEGVIALLLKRKDVNPNSRDNCGRTPLSFAAESRYQHVVGLSSETRDRIAASFPCVKILEEVVDLLPTSEGVTTCVTGYLPLDTSGSRPAPSSSPQEQSLNLKQSPPALLEPSSVLSIPSPAPASRTGFPFFFQTFILLLALAFLLFLTYGRCGDFCQLFRAIRLAWQ